jgi:predicted phage terminase large subunit-like protein
LKLETQNSVLALARADLACYSIVQWPPFELAAHHRIVVEKLEAVERGEIRRLMIFLPPRHGKSLLATQMFPAWYLGRHPDRFVISASYGQELADDFGRNVRNLINSPIHRTLFPTCRLADDAASMRRFNTLAGGSYYAVGRGGPITGRGAHLLILDDLLKDREEAQSETVRRNLHAWYAHVAYTRLQPGGAIVLIATRWHEDDLAGRLLNEHANENWVVVSLPAIAEVDESFRRSGEALWPERFPLADLQRIRQSVGSAAWASLYQQRPAAAEGAIFKRDWIRTYRDPPNSFQKIIQSWDTAFKTGAENDYSVLTTWGVTENGYFLLSFWRERAEFPELKRQVSSQAEQWKPHAILIEDKASGQSLLQELRLATRFPLLPIKVDGDKRARAEAVTPLFEAGRIFVPESAPWLDTYLDELAVFPAGTHDDAVDSTTQALNYLRGDSGGYGVLELMKKGWDGFVETWGTVEKDQAKMLVQPIELPRSAQVNMEGWKKWVNEGKAPPCPRPECGSTNTTLNGGRTGPVIHCNECSAEDGVLSVPKEEKPGHVHKWQSIPCGE